MTIVPHPKQLDHGSLFVHQKIKKPALSPVKFQGTTLPPGTRQAAVIGRRLSEDFAREVSDTRIPAQQSFVMDYRQARPAGAARLRVRVRVKPDHFYHGFFEAYLKGGGLSPQARKLIEEARDNAAKSAFDIYDERFALP